MTMGCDPDLSIDPPFECRRPFVKIIENSQVNMIWFAANFYLYFYLLWPKRAALEGTLRVSVISLIHVCINLRVFNLVSGSSV